MHVSFLRVRTTVNVLGDCLGAGIMQHMCGEGLREAHYDGVGAGEPQESPKASRDNRRHQHHHDV